jgi:hypothetical protein
MINLKDELTLGRLSLTNRVLFTGFLLVIGLGLLMSGLQILLTHGMADGEPGLSTKDIVYSYYGNRSGSKLETALNGKMKSKAPPEVNAMLIQWAHDNAPKAEWDNKIGAAFEKHCYKCHDEESDLPQLTKYEVAKELSEVDQGASVSSLTRVSHIHLFGISFIFLYVGWIFSMAVFNYFWKLILISSPFAFLILDVGSWWLTKYWPGYAVVTLLSGIGYSIAVIIMFVTSFAQMWLPRWTQQHHNKRLRNRKRNLLKKKRVQIATYPFSK